MLQPAAAEPPLLPSEIDHRTPSLTAHLSDRLDFRASVGHPNTSIEAAWLDARDEAHLTTGSGPQALLDWRLDTDGLRLTGGALISSQSFSDATAALGQGRTTGVGFAADRSWQPYLGLGWDHQSGPENRLDIQLDLGLLFDNMQADASGEATLLDQQRLLRQEFESFRYRPTISADFEYRF